MDFPNGERPPQLYMFYGTVVNGAGGAGTNSYTVQPGEGNILEIIDGAIENGDTSTRAVTARIDTGTNTELIGGGIIQSENLAAGNFMGLWRALSGPTVPAPTGRQVLGGLMRLIVTIASVAASEDTAFGFYAWLYGAEPTITLAGASTPTTTTEEARVVA